MRYFDIKFPSTDRHPALDAGPKRFENLIYSLSIKRQHFAFSKNVVILVLKKPITFSSKPLYKFMKNLCFIVCSILNLNAFSQISHDTIFLKREIVNDSYNIVYIDSSQSDSMKKDFQLSERSLKIYHTNLEFLFDSAFEFKHFKQFDLQTSWTRIYKFNGVFYNYIPSDGISNLGYKLTDSTLISISGSEVFGEAILKYQKESDTKFSLELLGYNKQKAIVTIELVDSDHSITLWTINRDGNETKHYMIVNKNLNQLPKVICECSSGKCHEEFQFDEPKLD